MSDSFRSIGSDGAPASFFLGRFGMALDTTLSLRARW
jgi:hypothetical protein